MDEERRRELCGAPDLKQIERYAKEARQRERHNDYNVPHSCDGKPSPSDDIVMLCEDVEALVEEARRLRGALEDLKRDTITRIGTSEASRDREPFKRGYAQALEWVLNELVKKG